MNHPTHAHPKTCPVAKSIPWEKLRWCQLCCRPYLEQRYLEQRYLGASDLGASYLLRHHIRRKNSFFRARLSSCGCDGGYKPTKNIVPSACQNIVHRTHSVESVLQKYIPSTPFPRAARTVGGPKRRVMASSGESALRRRRRWRCATAESSWATGRQKAPGRLRVQKEMESYYTIVC